MLKCLFCNSNSFNGSPFEDTVYNNKQFEYVTCSSCKLVQLNPLPSQEDLVKMYSLDYYEFKKVTPSSEFDHILNQIKKLGDYKTVLDFGCGGGRFLVNAMDKGYQVTGVDFGEKLIRHLEEAYPVAEFQEIDLFYQQTKCYDVIFVSNVLEHLVNPKEVLNKLIKRLTPHGLIVVDGPIENNYTSAGAFRKLLFGIRKKMGKVVSHVPRHIIYSNAQNQRQFFENSGLETLSFKMVQTPWPFPSKWDQCSSINLKIFFFVAKISKYIDLLIPNSGNVFYYIGRK